MNDVRGWTIALHRCGYVGSATYVGDVLAFQLFNALVRMLWVGTCPECWHARPIGALR